jgi:hypothetical protein
VTFRWDTASIELSDDEQQDEQLGSKEKFWAVSAEDENLWLVKFARGTGTDTRGEDWAEWLVQHLAEELGVPHARIVPVNVNGRRGIASKSVLKHGTAQRLVHGNSLLSESDAAYDQEAARGNPRYTVEAVKNSLEGVGQPLSFNSSETLNGFDVWVGYLILDAWTAGRDRHHENWAVISERERRTLSPSYDHGNALGCQETDPRRARCLKDAAMFESWAARGKSHHFAGKPDLVSLALQGVQLATPAAQSLWRDRLLSVDWRRIDDAVDAVPRQLMSDVTVRFTKQLLRMNMRRLMDAYPAT